MFMPQKCKSASDSRVFFVDRNSYFVITTKKIHAFLNFALEKLPCQIMPTREHLLRETTILSSRDSELIFVGPVESLRRFSMHSCDIQ